MTEATKTYGPAYDEKIDGRRIRNQQEAIKDFMLKTGKWWSLSELGRLLKFPEASISAQLRHLRKPEFGSYQVEKRRRIDADGEPTGTWEYRVYPKETFWDV